MDGVEVKIISDPKYLKILRSTVYHLAELCGFPKKEGNALTLAVDEAAANIIKHAYKNKKGKPIFMYCKIHDDRLEIVLKDSGRKVDAREIKSRELQDVKPGGLGVHFIKSTMDLVIYDNSLENGNQLTMAKYLPEVKNAMINVNISKHNSATIMKIEGEVDLYSSPEVRKSLLQLINDKTSVIIVNLEKVGYIDSSGVATLVEGLQEIGKYSGIMKLSSPNDTVRDVFELSNLDKVFEIHDTVEEALNNI